jgi:hypothetical protein
MKFYKYWMVVFAFSFIGWGSEATHKDPMWLYCDKSFTELLWMNFKIFDTCRSQAVLPLYPTDTGDKYDSSYINFNYQFSTDTMKLYDPFDPTTVTYSDYRPGYAGFKIDWDGGVTGFPVAKFKYLAITHKGPLPNHKVTIRFGYNTICGSPTTFNEIGSFTSSTTWKEDRIKIPDSITNIPADEKTRRQYYEMQVLITNTDPNGSPTSAPGNLKIDNVYLTNQGGEEESKGCGCGSGTGLALIPPIMFKAIASRKRKKQEHKTRVS